MDRLQLYTEQSPLSVMGTELSYSCSMDINLAFFSRAPVQKVCAKLMKNHSNPMTQCWRAGVHQ